MTELAREYGDGHPFGPEGPKYFTDPAVSWETKMKLAAVSNGCNDPEGLLWDWMGKLYPGLEIENIKPRHREAAAKEALIEYTIQNALYDQLVGMVAAKGDGTLLIDLTVTPHAIAANSDGQQVSATKRMVRGFATDEAFHIIERISGLFYDPETKLRYGYVDPLTGGEVTHMPEATRRKIMQSLNALEMHVNTSKSIEELDKKFSAPRKRKPVAEKKNKETSKPMQWDEVLAYSREFNVTPTHFFKDGIAQEVQAGKVPDLSHEHTGFIVTQVTDEAGESFIVKIITREPSDSFEERLRKLKNEINMNPHLTDLHNRLPLSVKEHIVLPVITRASEDSRAIMMKIIDGGVLGDTHEFNADGLSEQDVITLAQFIHEMQRYSYLFTEDSAFNRIHPSISDVFEQKYRKDSAKRTKVFGDLADTEVSQLVDVADITLLMEALDAVLPQFAGLFPDGKLKTHMLAHANMNASSFIRTKDGKLAIIDWNRLTDSNNFAFDASTVLTFLVDRPDLQKSFLTFMRAGETNRELFDLHLYVDLVYNRIPGELMDTVVKLYAAIKGNKPKEVIEHYALHANRLHAYLMQVFDSTEL